MEELERGVLQPKTFGFEWKIEHFFAGCRNVGDCYKSPAFPIRYKGKNTKWYLQVFPKGQEGDRDAYVSLYLHFQSDKSFEVTVTYELSIVSRKKNLRGQIKGKQFRGLQYHWGFPIFVKQSVIKDTDIGALIDDTLTIACRITLDPEIKKFDGYQMWLDDVQRNFTEFEILLENNSFGDVTFNVRGKKICLHKDILMCRNPVFKEMFEREIEENKKSTVDVTDVSYDAMKEFFRFIYTGKVENIEDVAKDLLIAADKYVVTDLKALCEKTLYDNLTIDNAIEYLLLTERCDTLHLKQLVIDFVVDNMKDVVKSSDFDLMFEDLKRDVVCEIFKAVANKNYFFF